eukprot:Nk52_evm43s279 gene=Nk52_evmTU43s279
MTKFSASSFDLQERPTLKTYSKKKVQVRQEDDGFPTPVRHTFKNINIMKTAEALIEENEVPGNAGQNGMKTKPKKRLFGAPKNTSSTQKHVFGPPKRIPKVKVGQEYQDFAHIIKHGDETRPSSLPSGNAVDKENLNVQSRSSARSKKNAKNLKPLQTISYKNMTKSVATREPEHKKTKGSATKKPSQGDVTFPDAQNSTKGSAITDTLAHRENSEPEGSTIRECSLGETDMEIEHDVSTCNIQNVRAFTTDQSVQVKLPEHKYTRSFFPRPSDAPPCVIISFDNLSPVIATRRERRNAKRSFSSKKGVKKNSQERAKIKG